LMDLFQERQEYLSSVSKPTVCLSFARSIEKVGRL
jgi:hypothetical protein